MSFDSRPGQPAEPAQRILPPAPASGAVVALLEAAVPPGQAGRQVYAGLKRAGRILARGAATVDDHDRVAVTLRALTATTVVPAGEYELWLTLDQAGLPSCYPSFGDWYVRETWTLGPGPNLKKLTVAPWQQKRLSRPENLVTIHYHRHDGSYDNVGLWTWDVQHRRTPPENELHEVGRDEFGLIYQLDRGEYGSPDKPVGIGLLPRLGGDWNAKDGNDKLWTPTLGPEVYLVGGTNQVWAQRPDVFAHVTAAFLDAPNRVVVQVSRLMEEGVIAPASVRVRDDRQRELIPVTVRLVGPPEKRKSNQLEAILFEPLDIAHRGYVVRIDHFAGAAPVVPRGVLDDADLFGDVTAVLGAIWTPRATTFRVFAPTAEAVEVVIYEEAQGDRGRSTHALQRAAKGVWEAVLPGDWEGKCYLWRLDGPELSPDREVLDISSGNTVNNSQRARITAMEATNPPGWDRGRRGPPLASPVDMVVYEMSVRDFTRAPNSGVRARGKFLGFGEAGTRLPEDPAIKTGLDHLVELGVTHVQLLPVADFANDETSEAYDWGYMTLAFNSPDGWFASNVNDASRVREFKQLVQALHERGLGVILDVVYNHTGQAASFNSLVPHYYYRYRPDGSLANGSGCGNEFRSESPMGRKFIIDSLKHWATEYGIDGFRFDLMALLDRDTMVEAERELRRINPQIVLYGEPWTAGPAALKGQPTDKTAIRETGIGAFNDGFRNAVKGEPDGPAPGFIQAGSDPDGVRRGLEGSGRDWAPTPAQTINYLTCHDNLVLYDKLRLSNPHASEADLIEMMKVGYLLLFTAQGVPFLHGGEEFACTKHGHHNSYNAPDAINAVDWSLKKRHFDLFAYTRDLIALRRAHPLFRLRTREQVVARLRFPETAAVRSLLLTLDGRGLPDESWPQAGVVVNSAEAASADVTLPRGLWHIAFDHHGAVGDERVVEGIVRVRHQSGLILYQR